LLDSPSGLRIHGFAPVVPVRELQDSGRGRLGAGTDPLAPAAAVAERVVEVVSKLGYFPDLAAVPPVVVDHVRSCLALGPEVEPSGNPSIVMPTCGVSNSGEAR
jgi:hypothetical protein